MRVEYVCSKKGCNCKDFYLCYDGRHIELRCRDGNHYIQHISKEMYNDLIEFENIADETGFNGGTVRVNNGSNITTINDFLDSLREMKKQKAEAEQIEHRMQYKANNECRLPTNNQIRKTYLQAKKSKSTKMSSNYVKLVEQKSVSGQSTSATQANVSDKQYVPRYE